MITGANKGIGFQTARLLGARGMTVLVGARDAERASWAAAGAGSYGVLPW